jgi:hypothetical protein
MENGRKMENVDNVYEILKNETMGMKKLDGKVLSDFRDMFQFNDEVSNVFYNEFNLLFLDKVEFENIRYLIPQHEVIVMVEIPEYNEFIAVIRYFQDVILNEILI